MNWHAEMLICSQSVQKNLLFCMPIHFSARFCKQIKCLILKRVKSNSLTHKGTFVSLFYWEFLRKQMLQAANTDLFNPLVPKAHNKFNKCQNLLFPLQIK